MKTITLLMFCSILTMPLSAQQTQVVGARSWNTISSLMGKSITEVRTVLKKSGLTDLDKVKDDETGMLAYSFYPVNTKDKDDEAAYIVCFINDKVNYINVSYEYAADNEIFKNDINALRKNLTENNFVLEEKKKVEDLFFYIYQYGKKSSATIAIDKDLAFFSLVMGDPKFVKMAIE